MIPFHWKAMMMSIVLGSLQNKHVILHLENIFKMPKKTISKRPKRRLQIAFSCPTNSQKSKDSLFTITNYKSCKSLHLRSCNQLIFDIIAWKVTDKTKENLLGFFLSFNVYIIFFFYMLPKRCVSRPSFNSMTSWHHTMSPFTRSQAANLACKSGFSTTALLLLVASSNPK